MNTSDIALEKMLIIINGVDIAVLQENLIAQARINFPNIYRISVSNGV
jgi:hypothetical protein